MQVFMVTDITTSTFHLVNEQQHFVTFLWTIYSKKQVH